MTYETIKLGTRYVQVCSKDKAKKKRNIKKDFKPSKEIYIVKNIILK